MSKILLRPPLSLEFIFIRSILRLPTVPEIWRSSLSAPHLLHPSLLFIKHHFFVSNNKKREYLLTFVHWYFDTFLFVSGIWETIRFHWSKLVHWTVSHLWKNCKSSYLCFIIFHSIVILLLLDNPNNAWIKYSLQLRHQCHHCLIMPNLIGIVNLVF